MKAIALEPVRFSHLKHIARSPAHYRHALTASYDSAAFRIGRLVDCAVLGGPQPVVFEGTRRGKAWEAFRAEHDERDIYTASEVAAAAPVSEAVLSNRRAMEVLEAGIPKRRIAWDWIGRNCSGEPDVGGLDVLVDLKTCRTADPARFAREAIWYGYHAQLAWYRNGLELAGKPRPREVYIVAAEKAPPYPVTVFRLTEDALDAGLRLCRGWLERLLVCEDADVWPTYSECDVPLDVERDPELIYHDEEDD